ncbi:MAG: hypothetical protein KC731_01235, partial [Myxococcales bacterium]|nr:hypothetical protein [Myxococcales bacterium]
NDTCQNGSCMGGGQNDCGNTPPACNEVTCDEQTESCSVAPANNGDPCQGTDLCVVGSTCNNGTCVGGEPNLCFFQPVPDECHVSVCNPSSGVCEPQPGNDGDGCTVMSDLCSVGNTCLGGICSGGSPKDCSQLTVGCFDGVCDTTTGQCAQNPIMPGNQCAEATDQCNVGICDMNGSCNPMPANENMACDTDGCFVGQTCSSGNCQGGTQITACINGDNCCPSGCDLTNDDDCGCDYALISDETQLDDPAITALITANGHYFTTLNNNGSTGVHTSNMALLNQYETIILHNHDRVLTTTEATNLSNWIQAGGSLLVTGYDSLGSPTDTVLANLVNCTGPADGPFSSSLLVVNNTHPIMLGPAQAFTLNQALIAGSTDHDTCNPGPGSTQLLTVSGSSSKLLVTDNVGQGMVIYWNGNGGASGPLHDWAGTGGSSQPALQNLFVNVIEHMCQ